MGVIYIPGKCVVDVEEDSYKDGCTGNYCNQWDFDMAGTYPDKESLINRINEKAYLDVKDVYFYDGSIRFSVMVDVENTPPSESQYEAWKKGEEKLYVADGFMTALFLPDFPHDMTEEEAKSFGIETE